MSVLLGFVEEVVDTIERSTHTTPSEWATQRHALRLVGVQRTTNPHDHHGTRQDGIELGPYTKARTHHAPPSILQQYPYNLLFLLLRIDSDSYRTTCRAGLHPPPLEPRREQRQTHSSSRHLRREPEEDTPYDRRRPRYWDGSEADRSHGLLQACLHSTDAAVQRLSRALLLDASAGSEPPRRAASALPPGVGKQERRRHAYHQRRSATPTPSDADSALEESWRAEEEEEEEEEARSWGHRRGRGARWAAASSASTSTLSTAQPAQRRGAEARERSKRHQHATAEFRTGDPTRRRQPLEVPAPYTDTSASLPLTPIHLQRHGGSGSATPLSSSTPPPRTSRSHAIKKDRYVAAGARRRHLAAAPSPKSQPRRQKRQSLASVCSVEESLAQFRRAYQLRQQGSSGLSATPLSLSRHSPHKNQSSAPTNVAAGGAARRLWWSKQSNLEKSATEAPPLGDEDGGAASAFGSRWQGVFAALTATPPTPAILLPPEAAPRGSAVGATTEPVRPSPPCPGSSQTPSAVPAATAAAALDPPPAARVGEQQPSAPTPTPPPAPIEVVAASTQTAPLPPPPPPPELVALRGTVAELEALASERSRRLRDAEAAHQQEVRRLRESADAEAAAAAMGRRQLLEAEEQRRRLVRDVTRHEVELEERAALAESNERRAVALQASLEAAEGREKAAAAQLRAAEQRQRELEAAAALQQDQQRRLEAELSEQRQQVQRLAEQKSLQESEAHAALEEVEAEFTQAVENYQSLLNDATARLEKLERTARKYKALKDAHEELQRGYQAAEARRREAAEEASRLRDDVRRLQDALDGATREASEDRIALQRAKKEASSLETALEAARGEAAEARAVLDSAATAGAARERGLEEKVLELEQRQDAAQRTATETIAALKRQLKEKEAKLRVLAASSDGPVQRLRGQLEDERRKRAGLEEQLQALRRRAKAAEERGLIEVRREQLRRPAVAVAATPMSITRCTPERAALAGPQADDSPAPASSDRSDGDAEEAAAARSIEERAVRRPRHARRGRGGRGTAAPAARRSPSNSSSNSSSVVSRISPPRRDRSSSADAQELDRRASASSPHLAGRRAGRQPPSPPSPLRGSTSSAPASATQQPLPGAWGEAPLKAPEVPEVRQGTTSALADMDLTAVGVMQLIAQSRAEFLSHCGDLVRSASASASAKRSGGPLTGDACRAPVMRSLLL
eukprot:gene12943-8799_t